MLIEVRVFCKTFVKALNIALLLSMISLDARELGLEKEHWEIGEEYFLEFLQNSSTMLTHFVIKSAYYKQRARNNAMLR